MQSSSRAAGTYMFGQQQADAEQSHLKNITCPLVVALVRRKQFATF